VLPFSRELIGADLSVALLYLLALGSVTSVAVLTGGWASNNKCALLGAFRTVSQLISYEIPQALSLLPPIMLAGTMSTVGLTEAQEVPYIIPLFISAVIFFISSIAETARSPFDILEADSEIVAGFNIEYGGMKFALFFLAEYAHMFAASMMFSIIFLGGYRLPLLDLVFDWDTGATFLAPIVILVKALLVVFLFLWIRGTLPRVRLDQLLALNWKFMVPLSLLNIIVVAIFAKLVEDASLGVWTLALLAANILMILGAWLVLRTVGKRARQREELLLAAITDAPQTASFH
jgi:NADH-quinone oxidoreductase subunit H